MTARRKFLAAGGALTVATTALVGASAQAALPPQTAGIVADLTPGQQSSNIDDVTALGSSVIFTQRTKAHGTELWKSDGTAAGTQLLADIYPGADSSNPDKLTAMGGAIYFTAHHPTMGRELWRTDGTAAGTQPVRDIRPGGYSSHPGELTAVGGTLFFTAGNSSSYANQLWKTDGTTAGTALVAQPEYAPRNLAAVGNKVYFSAGDATHGRELWSSDGTTTAMALDYVPGASGSSPTSIQAVGSKVTFLGGYYYDALVAFDPATATTETLAADVSSSSSRRAVVGNTLYFTNYSPGTGRELWRTDGTMAGTTIVSDLVPGPNSSSPDELTVVGGSLFFATSGSSASGQQQRLWQSNGTAAGTVQAGAWGINDGSGYYYYDQPRNLTEAGGTLFFVVDDGVSGEELWRSDGPGTTTMVKDIRPGWYGSGPSELTSAGSTLFFTALDGSHGREMWKTGAVPAPPPPPPPADTEVAGLKVTAKPKQKQKKKVSVVVRSVADEAITSKASGKIKVKGSKKAIKLSRKSVKTAAGKTASLKLTVKKKKLSAKVLRAIKKWRKAPKSKKKKLAVKATVTVVVTDAAGNKATKRVKVNLT